MVFSFPYVKQIGGVIKNPFFLFFVVFELFYLKNNGFKLHFFSSYANLSLIFISSVAILLSKNHRVIQSKFLIFIFYVIVFLTFFNSLVEQTLFFLQRSIEFRVSYFQVLCVFIFLLLLLVIRLDFIRLNKFLLNYFHISILYFFITLIFNYLTLIGSSDKIKAEASPKYTGKIRKEINDNKKSIILIVLDEYTPDSEIINSGMQNFEPLLEKFLKNNNFQVRTLDTYEASTFRSINRIFNSKYEDDFANPDIQNIKKQLFKTQFISDLNEDGYSFVNLSFFDFENINSFYKKDPYDIDSSFIEILKFSIFKLFYDRFFENKQENLSYNKNLLKESLNQLQQIQNFSNKFFYVHILMPHGPFYFGEEFNYRTRTLSNYLLYRNLTSHKLIELLNNIELDRYNILVISDHGYRSSRLINPYKVLFASMGFRGNQTSIESVDQLHRIIFR